jgi:hypothetical protein
MSAHSRVSQLTRTRECSVALSPPATSRRRGRPPARPPSCVVHAVTAPGDLSHAATVQRRRTLHFLDSSCQRNLLLPCRRLLSSTVTTSSAPAPYASPLTSSLTSRAPPRPGVPHRPLLPHRRAPLRPLTGALLPAEFTAAASPPW